MHSVYVRPDSVLKRLVEEALAHASGLDGAGIGVAVDSGAVMLSGQVNSYPELLIAEKAALRIQGVNVLNVTIAVAGAALQSSDLEIAIASRLALERAVNIPSGALHVVVHGAVITLTGSVPWDFQRQAATRAVTHLHGVRGVVDRIVVEPLVPAVNIEAGVGAALRRNARVGQRDITVVVDGGAVRLQGEVCSWQEKREPATSRGRHQA